LLLQN